MYLWAYAMGVGATGLTFFYEEVTDFFSPHAAAPETTWKAPCPGQWILWRASIASEDFVQLFYPAVSNANRPEGLPIAITRGLLSAAHQARIPWT